MLYVIATPIGNLDDITFRAVETLKRVDVVLCEDTRVTKRLLDRYNISVETLSFHQHSNTKRLHNIIERLKEGKDIALVTDAGTPSISDPGGILAQTVMEKCGPKMISPLPGPSAVITALSISGFQADHFEFLGFPPHKKGRKTFFEEIATREHTQVFYESTHRIEKALESLAQVIQDREIVVAREMTKVYESFYRGTPAEVTAQLKSDRVKGEFVVLIGSQKR